MKKKLLLFICVFALAFSLVACGGSDGGDSGAEGGDNVEVENTDGGDSGTAVPAGEEIILDLAAVPFRDPDVNNEVWTDVINPDDSDIGYQLKKGVDQNGDTVYAIWQHRPGVKRSRDFFPKEEFPYGDNILYGVIFDMGVEGVAGFALSIGDDADNCNTIIGAFDEEGSFFCTEEGQLYNMSIFKPLNGMIESQSGNDFVIGGQSYTLNPEDYSLLPN